MTVSIRDKLKEGIVLGDGGYLLALENRGYVQAGPFTPEVTIENPLALRALHEEFVHAGAEVLQVLTFYASENKLAQIGYGGRLADINRAAVRIAREAAGPDTLVAGNVCVTWKYEEGSAAAAEEAADIGVNYIGGCCGCEGSHIRQMARALGKMPSEEREWAVDYERPQSATEAYHHMRQ